MCIGFTPRSPEARSLIHRALLQLVALASLAGCSHQVFIASRTTALAGHTTVPPGASSGEMSISLGDKLYSGRWVYVSAPGMVSVGTATSVSGLRSVSTTGTGYGIPTGGQGSMILAAADGSSLHCTFSYSGWTSTGVGECQDNVGGMYDLQITK
jgi:hypothetical protein